MQKIKTGLIIPVYNVERTIEKVFDSISEQTFGHIDEILVIDNASTDRSFEIIQSYTNKSPWFRTKLSVFRNQVNYGYGSSIKAGFSYFLDKDVSHVGIIHGDYQVDPDLLLRNLFAEASNSFDVVLASRFTKDSDISKYSLVRKLGNYFFNSLTAICTGFAMSDSGTAMIVLKRETLASLPFENLSDSWQFHPQLNILIYQIPDVKISEIPMDWANSEAGSGVKLISYGCNLCWMLLQYAVRRRVLGHRPELSFSRFTAPFNRKFQFYPCDKLCLANSFGESSNLNFND